MPQFSVGFLWIVEIVEIVEIAEVLDDPSDLAVASFVKEKMAA